MPEEKTPEPTQEGQKGPYRQAIAALDPYRAAPIYVSGLSVTHRPDVRLFFMAVFSGMPLPAGPNQYDLHESLIGSFALDPVNARFLYENLGAFLKALEEEEKKQ